MVSLWLLLSTIPLMALAGSAAGQETPVQRQLQTAVEAEARGDWPAAEKSYTSILELQPGRVDESIGHLEALTRSHPRELEALQTLAQAYLTKGSDDGFNRTFARIDEVEPNSFRSHQLQAEFCAARGHLNEAAQAYEQAVARNPDAPGVNFALGDIYFGLGQYDKAEPALRKELEIDPHHPIVNLELGIIKNSRQQFDQAIRHLERALRVDGRLPDAHLALASAYVAKGRLPAAEGALRRAIALAPGDPQPYYQLAQVYRKLGRMDEARASLERFQKLEAGSRQERQRAAEGLLQKKP